MHDWARVGMSANLDRITLQLTAPIPGLYYVTVRLLGKKLPCLASSTLPGESPLFAYAPADARGSTL
jgi:hypothetical protein